MGNWDEALTRQVSFTDEWQAVDITNRGITTSSCLVFQSGSFAGTIELKKVQVFEKEKKQEIGDKVHECDYSTKSEYNFWHGSFEDEGASIGIVNGTLTVVNPTSKGNWERQYFVDDAITTENGKDYVMRVTIKGSSSGSLDCQMGDWSKSSGRKLSFTSEWQTLDIWFFEVPATSSHITFQSGGFVGTLEIKKVEVYSVNDVLVELIEGFKELTLDMCKSWNGTEPGSTAPGTAGEINLNTAMSGGGVVYGGNVPWSVYADLTGYSKLVVTGTPGFPVRILYNRIMNDEGGDGTYGEVVQELNEMGYTEFNLLSWGTYAHLNSIKKAGWGGEPSGMINELLLLGTGASLEYVKIGSVGYSTFSTSYPVNLYNVKGYTAKYANGKVTLTRVYNVPANNGVIIEALEGTYGLPVVSEADALTDNDLKVSDGSVVGDESTIFVLANGNNGVGFYLVKSGNTIPAGKAYLEIPEGSARSFIGFGDEATGISEVAAKVAVDNNYYDLQGRSIAMPTKGLYIVNGKKVLVK